MPTKGQKIVNPINKDSYEFLETAKDTKGERVIMKATIERKGQLVPKHFHVFQDETFEVVTGELTVWFEGKIHKLSAGEKITLLKNTPHNHYNEKDTPVTYIHNVWPALDFDYLIENLVGLAADTKAKNKKYDFIQQLVSLKYLDSKSYLADVPTSLQNIVMNIVAPIARLFGYRAIYKKYSGIEK
jgi:quercetin dioxygenase-like cupin family protein